MPEKKDPLITRDLFTQSPFAILGHVPLFKEGWRFLILFLLPPPSKTLSYSVNAYSFKSGLAVLSLKDRISPVLTDHCKSVHKRHINQS